MESFGDKFEYCDFAPGAKTNPQTGCITKADELLETCLETQGNPTNIYQLDAKPVFTGISSSYSDIAIKGFQKVEGVPAPDETGAVAFFDICFDFVIVESLQEGDEGVESTFWKGYFSFEVCIPGLPVPCICDTLTPIASYNF